MNEVTVICANCHTELSEESYGPHNINVHPCACTTERLRADNAKLRVALELTSFQLDRLVHRTNMPAILGSLTFAHEAISIAKRTLEETK